MAIKSIWNRRLNGIVMKSLAEIKAELSACSKEERTSLLESLKTDTRTGVQKLIEKYEKEEQKLLLEIERIEKMKFYENQYPDAAYICGIDEVGRGPLAGPVVAGAVILDKNKQILYLNDSKKLSEAKREELSAIIKENAIDYQIGVMSPQVIDDVNILQATYKAMQTAVRGLKYTPDVLLNDAVVIPELSMEQVKIIKGDAKSISIAAASIIAKVERDHMMMEYDKLYPEYGFARNKGYGSAEHIEALKKYGPCPIHRTTFIKNFL